MKVDAATVQRDPADTGRETLLVSNAGGLTQFGAYIVTLPPSAKAFERHWHSVEDEFLLVLDGTATVIDANGAHQLGAGDAAAWRKGDPNAHHVLNQSAAPVRYLIIGSRVAEDNQLYPAGRKRRLSGTCADLGQVCLASAGGRSARLAALHFATVAASGGQTLARGLYYK